MSLQSEFLNLDYSKKMMQLTKTYADRARKDSTFVNKYKTTNSLDDATFNKLSDKDIADAYLKEYPNLANKAELESIDIQKGLKKNLTDYYQEYGSIPTGLFQYTPGHMENIITPQYKKGGNLTAQDRIKLQRIKEFNKTLRDDSKGNLNAIIQSDRDFAANFRSLQQSARILLKKMLR